MSRAGWPVFTTERSPRAPPRSSAAPPPRSVNISWYSRSRSVPPIPTCGLRNTIPLGTVLSAAKCASSAPDSVSTRAILVSSSPPQAMILMRPSAAVTVARRVSRPSIAVSRCPEVSTRPTPHRTSASTASATSSVMSKARWQVTAIGPAACTSALIRASSIRPCGVRQPTTTPVTPISRSVSTSSSMLENS
jgi:hypothetical protein